MANTDFGILLKTLLDKSGINSELEQVQKIVNKYTIDIMPELKTASLKNQMKAVSQEIANDFNKAFGTNLTGNDVFKAFENQAKQAEKAVKEETKAIEAARKEQESLTNAMAKGREQAELSRQTEQKRQQMAQNNAINKALEQEYQERQKNIEAARKQAELDKQNALAFTKSASERLSSAISKYSYGDTSDANAMMKQMNRGLSNFGDLSNVQGNITQLSSTVDKIIADLKLSHEQSLQALNEEIKAEQTLQSQKDTFNKKNINAIDYEIQKREEEAKAFSSMLQAQMQEQQKMQSEVNKIQLSTDITKIENDYKRFGIVSQEVENNLKELKIARENALKAEGTDRASAEIEKYNQKLAETKSSWKELQATQVSMNQRTSQMTTMQEWMRKNQKATKLCGVEVEKLIQECLTCNKVRFDQIKNEFKALQVEAGKAGKLGNTLWGSLIEQGKGFIQWYGVSGVVTECVNAFRNMYTAVVEVDSAMIELTKVSNASSNELKNYFDEAAKSAKDLGASVSDVINATADWSRLGYSLPDSKKLAEIATLYKNVGDGIDVDTANQSLVSTLQGFKLNAEDAMHIVDSFNEVANRMPIDSAGIGEALQRSASSMYAAGNTLEETIGLVTAANAVVQDPDSVGTAYKTISMRIRGAKTEMEQLGLETDGMVESTATLQKEILALTGVDIMQDENTFKSTYAILDELATKWSDLTDIQQASVTELIAGKRQGNIVSALMNNFEMARESTQIAVDSTGSALREQENYEKGIQYSLDRLSASWQEFSNHFLDSSFIKGIVDFGNTTINVIDKVTSALGSLGTIGVIGGGILGAKNAGKCRMSVRISNCFEYALHA